MSRDMFRRGPKKHVVLTTDNIEEWPKYAELYKQGHIVLDSRGRFRYPHGAPVGELVLARTIKDGEAIYKESAEEWFDPDSQSALEFNWPE